MMIVTILRICMILKLLLLENKKGAGINPAPFGYYVHLCSCDQRCRRCFDLLNITKTQPSTESVPITLPAIAAATTIRMNSDKGILIPR